MYRTPERTGGFRLIALRLFANKDTVLIGPVIWGF